MISYCCAMTCPLTITVPVAPSPLCFVKTSLAPFPVGDGATARLWDGRPIRTRGEASGALTLPTRRVDLHAALQSDRGGNAPSTQFSDEGLDPLSTRAPVLQPIDGIPGDEVHMERIPESPTRYLTLRLAHGNLHVRPVVGDHPTRPCAQQVAQDRSQLRRVVHVFHQHVFKGDATAGLADILAA